MKNKQEHNEVKDIHALMGSVRDYFGESHTYKFWLKRIPDPIIRDKALQNLKKQPDYKIGKMCDSLPYAIWNGFLWMITPEGHEYWEHYYNSLVIENNSVQIRHDIGYFGE